MLLSLNVLGQKTIYVNSVLNSVKVGYLANNKQLELGVKNVLEEALQDKGYELVADKWDAVYLIDVEIVYFDYEQTKMNVGISHKDENAVVIRMKGSLSKEGVILKDVLVTDKSKEIVSATGVIASDGKFSSAMVRNAIKKTCVLVVEKLN
jgi:dihydroxyacid dehydratase/phosphogluconate dehydratase